MNNNPYKHFPDYAFWKRAVVDKSITEVDPVVSGRFKISKTDKIATAGSCFAQHIARGLKENKFNFFITELSHALLNASQSIKYNYGIFSARYGNIYTARQLVQLFNRAYGFFKPIEDYWQSDDGSYIDPFRPQIQPSGFKSMEEYYADRRQHFSAVRKMFQELDVFIFTLGLTECWKSMEDGSAYPLCPGVAGGIFDKNKYAFENFGVEDTVKDLIEFFNKLFTINGKCRVILTVSPVPLVATAVDRHVLASTIYSKSVLRVSAEYITEKFDNVAYFPSYEIITGNFNRGKYFAEDLRTVTPEGINHVMNLFFKHYTEGHITKTAYAFDSVIHKLLNLFKPERINTNSNVCKTSHKHIRDMENIIDVLCDEEALDKKK